MAGRVDLRSGGAVLVAVGALVFGGILLARGGSDNSAAPKTPAGVSPRARAKKPPLPARPRGHRERVQRGRDGALDEPGAGTGPLLGIADQKPETFADARFLNLGVTRTRLNTPWNSVFTEPARLGAWLAAVQAARIEPLVAFEHARGDRCPAQPCVLPTTAAYERAARAFHARYPWVHLLEPWNEANSATQPTGTHPERAAGYYLALRRACPSCQVPGADVTDGSNLQRWLGRYSRALHGTRPHLWGLHNYSDVNRFRNTGTRRALRLLPGEVWMTEAGGIVSFATADGRVVLPYDENRAARATAFMFQLARQFGRIKRVYVYQWKIDFGGNRFDAGLVAPDGRPRPAFAVVEKKEALLR